jgi:hypothetical protein
MSNTHDNRIGAYATPRLVGRDDVINQVVDWIAAAGKHPQMIFIFGQGGIGKTRLLVSLQSVVKQQNIFAAKDLIDLYDTIYHSQIGLVRAIHNRLALPEEMFENYEQEERLLAAMEEIGAIVDLYKQRKEALEDFVKELRIFASEQRVVIMLDTAERLIYVTDEIADMQAHIAEGWQWLVQEFRNWENVTLIIAGREEAQPLLFHVADNTSIDIRKLTLQPFSFEESDDYFDAAAEVADSKGEKQTANLLRNWPLELRQQIHTSAGGRPILLALMADIATIRGSEVADALKDTLTSKHMLSNDLEDVVIELLIQTTGLGDCLKLVGRLPKGVSKDLLMLIMIGQGLPKHKVEEYISTLYTLSFVKQRDDRIFLHDEMYAILERKYYRDVFDRASANSVLDRVIQHLNAEYEAVIREQNELFEPVEMQRDSDLLNRERLGELMIKRRMLLPEILYYRLRRDAVRGFKHYFRYSFEAIISGDTSLDIELLAALLAFAKDRDPSKSEAIIDNLERELIVGVAIIRPVARALAENNLDEAVRQAQRLRIEHSKALTSGAPGTEAILGVWEAYARIYRAKEEDSQVAKFLLDSAISNVEKALQVDPLEANLSEAKRWRSEGVLAFAYQVRGYLNWAFNALQEANHDYRNAIKIWRRLKVYVNLGTSLNDLGFVRAEQGFIDDAQALVIEALEIRQQLGARAAVGYSLNTLGLIHLFNGSYQLAIERSAQANSLFTALNYPRGIILSRIALAEANRRYSGTRYALSPYKQAEFLYKARKYAQDAYKDAQTTREKLRQIDALIELGCTARDLARLNLKFSSVVKESIERLADDCRRYLLQAAENASEIGLKYRQLDALVNLAFLEFAIHNLAQARYMTISTLKEFPSEYQIDRATGSPSIARKLAQVQIWSQLGKLYSLYGQIALEEYNDNSSYEKNSVKLYEVVHYFLLSLQYSAMHNQASPVMTQARDLIYRCLKTLNSDELKTVERLINTLEQTYKIERSELRQLLDDRAL